MRNRDICYVMAAILLVIVPISLLAAERLQFNRDVRPILADHCFPCHGPDAAKRKADLRLDMRDVAIEAGAIAPGKVDKSSLVERIFSEDADTRMPPAEANKQLTPKQKGILKQWIAEGAEYQKH